MTATQTIPGQMFAFLQQKNAIQLVAKEDR